MNPLLKDNPQLSISQIRDLYRFFRISKYIYAMTPNLPLSKLLPKRHKRHLLSFLLGETDNPFVLVGGRGSLKTQFGIVASLLAITKGDGDAIIISPSVSISKAHSEQVEWNISKIPSVDSISSKNPFLHSIVLNGRSFTYKPTGCSLYCLSASNKSVVNTFSRKPFSIVVIDEAQCLQLDTLKALLQSFQKKTRVIVSGNPYENHPLDSTKLNFNNFFKSNLKPSLQISYLDVPKSWLGNAFFSEADALKSLNPEAYYVEYLAKPLLKTSR